MERGDKKEKKREKNKRSVRRGRRPELVPCRLSLDRRARRVRQRGAKQTSVRQRARIPERHVARPLGRGDTLHGRRQLDGCLRPPATGSVGSHGGARLFFCSPSKHIATRLSLSLIYSMRVDSRAFVFQTRLYDTDQDVTHRVSPPSHLARRPRYSLVWKLVFFPKSLPPRLDSDGGAATIVKPEWGVPSPIGSAAKLAAIMAGNVPVQLHTVCKPPLTPTT